MVVAHEIPFWAYCGLEHFLTTNKLLQHRKIQGGKQADADLLSRSYSQIVRAHVLQVAVLLVAYDLFAWRGVRMDSVWPSFLEMAGQMAFFMVVCDTLLYWSHRTLHHPALYSRFHKQHHEFKAPIPVSSEYFSFVEGSFWLFSFCSFSSSFFVFRSLHWFGFSDVSFEAHVLIRVHPNAERSLIIGESCSFLHVAVLDFIPCQ